MGSPVDHFLAQYLLFYLKILFSFYFFVPHVGVGRWRSGKVLDLRSTGLIHDRRAVGCNLGQVVHKRHQAVLIWYRRKLGR